MGNQFVRETFGLKQLFFKKTFYSLLVFEIGEIAETKNKEKIKPRKIKHKYKEEKTEKKKES